MLRLIETLHTLLEAKDELKRVLGLRQGYNPAGTHTHRGREGCLLEGRSVKEILEAKARWPTPGQSRRKLFGLLF
jgi:hypothetical protein